MSLPADFVKQTYDLPKQKDYALSDDFVVKKIYEIIKEYKITKVVEAGIYKGRSTVELSYLVDEVIGIEIYQKWVDETERRMKENFRTNYKIYKGNSPDILIKIIPELDLNHTIFFLDAHMSASGDGSDENAYWPILDEIKSLPKNKGIIILHDVYVPMWGDLSLHDPKRLGYDTYVVNGKKQKFDYEFIKKDLMDWSPTHRIEYNNGNETSGDQRGVMFIYPN